MKIGVTANMYKNAYDRWGEDRYKKMKEHGFSCMDFNMADTNSAIYTSSQEESDALLLHEKNLADAAGIEISQVHGPWRYPTKDATEEDRLERMEKMKKSLRATSILGCKDWVIHPLFPCEHDMRVGTQQETWDINLSFMRELLATAKQYGITICLENMPFCEFSLSKPTDILRFVREINDDNFKICLDTGHITVFEDLLPGDSVRSLGKEIRTLHVHDNKEHIDLHMMPYFGNIDWKDFADALKEIEFNGVFSLETLPPVKLDNDMFEKSCIMLAESAKRITANL